WRRSFVLLRGSTIAIDGGVTNTLGAFGFSRGVSISMDSPSGSHAARGIFHVGHGSGSEALPVRCSPMPIGDQPLVRHAARLRNFSTTGGAPDTASSTQINSR